MDGSAGTRWAASGEAVPQWWMLEFSKARQLTGVEVSWRNPTWYSHKVEVSDDGRKWKTVSDASGKKTIPAQSGHSFSAKAKFLRVTVDALGSGWATFTELKPLFKAQ